MVYRTAVSPPLREPGNLAIGLVTETYPPEINGVAHTLSHLVNGLRQRGHRVHLVRPRQDREDPQNYPDAACVRGYAIPFYPELRIGVPQWGQLRRLWQTTPPEVVYVATEGPLGYAALREAMRQRIPVISGFHTNFHAYSRHYRLGPLAGAVFAYLRWFHNRTACTLAPTDELCRALTRHGIRSTSPMARGVDTRLFDPARRSPELRRQWGLGPDDLAVLYVGRLAPEKNLDLVLRAFQTIRNTRPDARLILVGDGPMHAELSQAHGEIRFCGMRRGSDLATHYASADLLLFPSETETFGNVVLEGMASGLPVLAYDYAAARMHITSGRNGVTVPLGDAAAYLQAARTLAADTARLRTLGAAARRNAEALGWEHVVARFEALLRQHAQCGGGSRGTT